jgi:hypothetical protein
MNCQIVLRSAQLQSFALALLSILMLTTQVAAQGAGSDRLRITNSFGNVIFDQTLVEGQEATPIGIGFDTPAFSVVTGDDVRQVLGLLDPGTSIVSDRVFVQVFPTTQNPVLGPQQGVNIFMCSDSPEGVAPPFAFVCPTTINVTTGETGNLQNVTNSFTILNGSGLTVEVQSDIEAVPEPATLFLFSSGLVGLATQTWRRRSRK